MTAAGRITATRITAGTFILVHKLTIKTGNPDGSAILVSTTRTRPGTTDNGEIVVAQVTGVRRDRVQVNGWRQKSGTVIAIITDQGVVEASPSQTFSIAKPQDVEAHVAAQAEPITEAEHRAQAGWDAVEEGAAFDADLQAQEQATDLVCPSCGSAPGESPACSRCIDQDGPVPPRTVNQHDDDPTAHLPAPPTTNVVLALALEQGTIGSELVDLAFHVAVERDRLRRSFEHAKDGSPIAVSIRNLDRLVQAITAAADAS